MSTVRSGHQATLLVVDVQVGVMAESWDAPRIIANVAQAVAKARAAGVPVVWVQHESDELPRDSAPWALVPELVPAPGDQRVYKRYPSSFEATDLDACLAAAGTTHVVLAGAQTNWCIRATAYAALDRGYDLTLLKDAHTTAPLDLEDGSRVEAASMISDLNVAMKWLSYPGRKNATASVDAFDYAAAAGAAESNMPVG